MSTPELPDLPPPIRPTHGRTLSNVSTSSSSASHISPAPSVKSARRTRSPQLVRKPVPATATSRSSSSSSLASPKSHRSLALAPSSQQPPHRTGNGSATASRQPSVSPPTALGRASVTSVGLGLRPWEHRSMSPPSNTPNGNIAHHHDRVASTSTVTDSILDQLPPSHSSTSSGEGAFPGAPNLPSPSPSLSDYSSSSVDHYATALSNTPSIDDDARSSREASPPKIARTRISSHGNQRILDSINAVPSTSQHTTPVRAASAIPRSESVSSSARRRAQEILDRSSSVLSHYRDSPTGRPSTALGSHSGTLPRVGTASYGRSAEYRPSTSLGYSTVRSADRPALSRDTYLARRYASEVDPSIRDDVSVISSRYGDGLRGKKSSGESSGSATTRGISQSTAPTSLYERPESRYSQYTTRRIRSTSTMSEAGADHLSSHPDRTRAWLNDSARQNHRSTGSLASTSSFESPRRAGDAQLSSLDRDSTLKAINALLSDKGLVVTEAPRQQQQQQQQQHPLTAPSKLGSGRAADLTPSRHRLGVHRSAVESPSPAALARSPSMASDLTSRTGRSLTSYAHVQADSEHYQLLLQALEHFEQSTAALRESGSSASAELSMRINRLVQATTKLNTGLRVLSESEVAFGRGDRPAAFEKQISALVKASNDQVRGLTESLLALTQLERERGVASSPSQGRARPGTAQSFASSPSMRTTGLGLDERPATTIGHRQAANLNSSSDRQQHSLYDSPTPSSIARKHQQKASAGRSPLIGSSQSADMSRVSSAGARSSPRLTQQPSSSSVMTATPSTPVGMTAPSRLRKASIPQFDALNPTLDSTNAAANTSPTRDALRRGMNGGGGGRGSASSSYSSQPEDVDVSISHGSPDEWRNSHSSSFSSSTHSRQAATDSLRSAVSSGASHPSSIRQQFQAQGDPYPDPPGADIVDTYAPGMTLAVNARPRLSVSSSSASRPTTAAPPIPVRSPERPISGMIPLSPSDASLLMTTSANARRPASSIAMQSNRSRSSVASGASSTDASGSPEERRTARRREVEDILRKTAQLSA